MMRRARKSHAVRHWLVTHANGEQTRHYTHGDDPAAEGIDTGVSCIKVPEPAHDRQVWDKRKRRWKDCPSKQAQHDQAMRKSMSRESLIELVLTLEARVSDLESRLT